MPTTTELPLLQYSDGGHRILAYDNRLEIQTPRLLTLGFTHKTETIYYSSILSMNAKARSITIRISPLSTRMITGSKKEIRTLVGIINAHR